MAKDTAKARKETLVRGRRRAAAERRRTGLKLTTTPPKPIQRGKFPTPPVTAGSRAVSVKAGNLINVITGAVTKKRVEKATEPKRKKKR